MVCKDHFGINVLHVIKHIWYHRMCHEPCAFAFSEIDLFAVLNYEHIAVNRTIHSLDELFFMYDDPCYM